MEAELEQLSDYELERGKPIPTLNHAYVQGNLLAELTVNYRSTYTTLSQLNLTMPVRPDAVPDVAIYPIRCRNSGQVRAVFQRGVQSCWLVMPSLQAIAVYSAVGKYPFVAEGATRIDPATALELAISNLFS